MHRALAVSLWLAVTACTDKDQIDTDGDGLSDETERRLGTDPYVRDTDRDGLDDGDELEHDTDPLIPDTDGDGLSDGDEIDYGTDPHVIDTDGDGYTDRDEVFESKDPTDPDSVIYEGGWPYVFDKDAIPGGDRRKAEIGKRFARVALKDQFGDRVDLFDFYNGEDKPVVLNLSTSWCEACKALAEFVEGESDDFGYHQMWPAGPDVVARGDVYWITILVENLDQEPATKPTVTQWYQSYPLELVPVLADTDREAADYVNQVSWPTILLLESDLQVSSFVSQWSTGDVLPELQRRFPQ